jgi:hypothetical protein
MNLKRLLMILAAGALCLGLFSATATAGKKKKKTAVVVNVGSVLKGKQNVKVSGHLKTSKGCKPARAMRLFWTDSNGVVIGTLDGSSSDANGNWKLQGKLPAAPTANDRLQVKAKKRTVKNRKTKKKTVCRAGLSQLIVIS